MGHGNKELAILGLMYMLGKCFSECDNGFESRGRHCVDVDECKEHLERCGENTKCFNTNGSFYCQCEPGYSNKRNVSFTSLTGQCQDINECIEDAKICGHGAYCTNLIGSYKCNCHLGYTNATSSHRGCIDIDECNETENHQEDICGMGGSCKNINGSYWCKCLEGFTNYGNKRTPCSELTCDNFNMDSRPEQSLRGLENIWKMMRNSCLTLYNPSPTGEESADGTGLLEILLTETDTFLSPGSLDSSEHVTLLLNTVENSIKLIGPQLKENRTKRETNEIEADIAVERGKTRPIGLIHLTNQNASLVTDWETATGLGTYPGFALATLLSYKSLVISADKSFEELKGHARDGVDPSFKIGSRVVSVVVSNPSTQNLSHSVNITLRHVQDTEESPEYICAYWKETGVWSEDGCYKQWSNASHTVCICNHLSSFAVLMALYDMEHPFALTVLTKIGLSISLLCLILSILTFKFCRSIQGTRTAIHLHLCVCLFMADLIFLAGISQTKHVGGCRAVAALLHYFFLGVFTWMLLEGVQLYRMVVLVFNATIRPLYLYVTGYGTPLVIIVLSAIIRPDGYGTKKHCWLSLENGFIWSFFGPVCLIIIINVFFFIITVWKLAQKFTSLNPDLSKLHKIKAFTVTAIAQMCILGLMWAFGAFLFYEGTTVVAYIFTILNSLQGALVFIMHCLLSKQVREEYAYFLSCICKPQKYSDLSSTNPSSSQSQGSQTGPHTGESQT